MKQNLKDFRTFTRHEARSSESAHAKGLRRKYHNREWDFKGDIRIRKWNGFGDGENLERLRDSEFKSHIFSPMLLESLEFFCRRGKPIQARAFSSFVYRSRIGRHSLHNVRRTSSESPDTSPFSLFSSGRALPETFWNPVHWMRFEVSDRSRPRFSTTTLSAAKRRFRS